MSEGAWQSRQEVSRLLTEVRTHGLLSARKARLLMCGLARSLWASLTDERSQWAVEAAEALADGESDVSLPQIAALARGAAGESSAGYETALRGAGAKLRRLVKEAAARAVAASVAAWAVAEDPLGWSRYILVADDPYIYDEQAHIEMHQSRHIELVRDIFGNPVEPRRADPVWLTRGDGVVANLARRSYDDRSFDRLPILADALEDVGCADAVILVHLRGPGPHVRGCWVLDLLLGKE